jgi:uncharacterized protein (TIGR02996 family)
MTFQARETLVYRGQECPIGALPLESCERPVPEFGVISSGCWRGYRGTWEVRDEILYLLRLDAPVETETRDGLDEMFPDRDGIVAATWFSGEITTEETWWQPEPTLFHLLFLGGKLLLEEAIDSSGRVTDSRMTDRARGIVDAQEWGFLAAIRESLDDEALKLVYADWLEERGDPRSRILRDEVERSRGRGVRRREVNSLLSQDIPTGYVDPEDRTWYWRQLVGIPAMAPEDASDYR